MFGFKKTKAEVSAEVVAESNRLRDIINSVGDNLIVVDNHLQVELINKTASELLGVSVGKARDQRVSNILTILKGEQIISDLDSPIARVIKTGQAEKTDIESDYYIQDNQGNKTPVSFIIRPLITGLGNSGAVMIFRDITSEKKFAESQRDFFSVASHQLRTPLTTIKWINELLLSGDFGSFNDEQKQILKELTLATNRMVDLISDLLNAARIESRGFLVNPEEADIEYLYNEVIKELTPLILQKESLVKFNKSANLGLVKTVPRILSEIMKNLLTNSIKYTPDKGKIEVNVFTDEINLLIDIKDNGIGIPKKQQERVFTKFFRADNVAKINTDGTGLGLYIAKQLAVLLEGKIWFESEENKGTVFHLSFPLSGPKPLTSTQKPSFNNYN